MKNGELARAVCFQESAEEGNADSIAESVFPLLLSDSDLKKVLAKDPPLCYNTESAGMARLF